MSVLAMLRQSTDQADRGQRILLISRHGLPLTSPESRCKIRTNRLLRRAEQFQHEGRKPARRGPHTERAQSDN